MAAKAKTEVEEKQSGQYRNLRDGNLYSLTILDKSEVQFGRTHQAKSETGFWDGTPEEFRAQFDKL